MRREHCHFRCDKHAVEAAQAVKVGDVATYRCGMKGCDAPAKAYWYRGEQFAVLKPKNPAGVYDC